jgi:mannose-6-phosphate isomerase-like protein (cupin superfamily)
MKVLGAFCFFPCDSIEGMNLRLVGFALLMAVSLPPCCYSEGADQHRAKVVALDTQGYKEILSGPPESVRLKSGYVVLAPKQSVGKHSTGHHEELLVVLEGEGEMTFADGTKLGVKANSALYCPPETEHNVTNTGHSVLRYVYVVADTQ